MASEELGQLEKLGERARLQFTRRVAHAPERVWRALTEPQHLEHWFPDGIEVHDDWKVGSSLTFGSGDDTFTGEVIVCDPPKTLEFTWGTDTLRFELEPDGDGTVITLLDTFAELGKAARDAAGWHECLAFLEDELDGRARRAKWGDVWAEVHPSYVERFPPEASTIGPPGDGEPAAS